MSETIFLDDLFEMSRSLRHYDVTQKGWEHEGKGLDFNLKHTLEELVRARRKDFFKPESVRNEIVPDAMQYAFRIARWTKFSSDLVMPGEEVNSAVKSQSRLWVASPRLSAYSVAEIRLADYEHSRDHDALADEAEKNKIESLPIVSQALMYFSLESANEFGFNLKEAFADRLTNLRDRFGIGQP